MCHSRRLALVTIQAALFLGAINLVWCVTNAKLHVQGLFPLTGKHASRGYAELAGARMAMKRYKSTDVQFAHNDSMCNPEIESKVTIEAIATEGSNIILLGGGCQASSNYVSIGKVLPQIIFESIHVTSSELVINSRPTLTSLHAAIAALITRQGWSEVAIVYDKGHIYEKGSAILKDTLLSRRISSGVYLEQSNRNVEKILKDSTLRIIILYLSASRAKDFLCRLDAGQGRYRWIVPTVNHTDLSKACPQKKPTVLTLDLKQVVINRDFARDIEEIYDIHGEDIVSAAYSYDALSFIIQSLNSSTKNDDVMDEIATNVYIGATGSVEFDEGGQRMFQARLSAHVGGKDYSYGRFYSSLSRDTESKVLDALNVSDHVTTELQMEGVGLVFFIIMTSLAIIIMIYTIVIMGYVIKMREERFYKMTSPNINIVILLSAILVCLHVILTGLSGIRLSLNVVRNAHLASRYLLCVAFSMFYGAALMKTWRVYVIFKNLNANGKLTRDVVLVAVVFALVIVDVILVSIWSFADPLVCDVHNSTMKYEITTGIERISQIHVCWSDLQPLWVSLIYLYKAAILATCIYFAWQTRHVTLPSMQDAPYMYVVILNGAFIGVLLVPSLVLFPTDEKLSYGVTSLGLLYLASANISLLFIPKFVTYRQIQKGLKKDDKLAFSESLKKTQEATEKTGCLNSCFGSAEKDKAAWQEVLSVEIENLKAAVKQKDTTIRELNDRLYYGADKFQQYLTRRQPTTASADTPSHETEPTNRSANASAVPTTQMSNNRVPNRAINGSGPQISSSGSHRHSHAYSDTGQYFTDSQRRLHESNSGISFSDIGLRRHSHPHSDHGIDNGAYRSRSNSRGSRISVQIHQNSDDSTSTMDEDSSIIPTPRLIMAPPIEQRSNLQTMANVAHVRSLEDISHDSAIENPPDSSDRDSEQIYAANHPRTTYTPVRPNASGNRLPFPKYMDATPGSDDSGIAAIYSPVSMPGIYSPIDYKNQRNNPGSRYTYDDPPRHATTIV